MRVRAAAAGLPLLLIAAAAGPAACGGGGGGETAQSVGGRVTLSRIVMGQGAGALLGIGSFYAPPGPEVAGHHPDEAGCVMSTASAVPSPSATAAPIAWRDAGESILLRSGEASLVLDRFPNAGGAIVYLSAEDADPAAGIAGGIYDVELAGSSGANGLPAGVVEGAVVMPLPVGLYAPDFSLGSVPLPRGALQIGWDAIDGAELLELTLAVAGSAGDVTLACSVPDHGVFEVSAAQMAALPAGAGTLSLTRVRETSGRLTATTSLVGRGEWVESGPFTLP